MKNRLLMIDKNESEYDGDYNSIQRYIDSLTSVLQHRGFAVSVNTELSRLTDELYRSQNCVLAHPTRQKFPRLMQLHREYPSVGLIIITGPGKDESDF